MRTRSDNLDSLIDKIVVKLTELYHYVNEYNIIFNEDIKTKTILDSSRSSFWTDLYWLYWNYFTIRICNLMDQPETYGNKNLSFYQLIKQIRIKELACTLKVLEIVEGIEGKISPFRNARKKAFAHFDLEILLSKQGLDLLKLDDIEWILSQFSVIINLVNSELQRDTYLFGMRSLEGARRIIGLLSMGIDYRNNLGKKETITGANK